METKYECILLTVVGITPDLKSPQLFFMMQQL